MEDNTNNNIFLIQLMEKVTGKKINDINEIDIDLIQRISLNNLLHKDNCVEIKDLVFLKKLKDISISGYSISKNEIDILSFMKELQYIQFDFCSFNDCNIEFTNNLELLTFNVCSGLKPIKMTFDNTKQLKIIGSSLKKEKIDIKSFNTFSNLLELSINNFDIDNINFIKEKAPKLIKLNIDGSIIDEKLINGIMINSISHKKEFIRADLY